MQHSLLATATLALAALSPLALASDHKEAPIIGEDPSADIADFYAFLNPSDPSRLVLVLTGNPFSAPSEGPGFQFSPNVRHVFHIDNDLDGIADEQAFVTMRNGKMLVKLTSGAQLLGDVTAPTFESTPNPVIVNSGLNGITSFAGPRDDPFFFDVVGFRRFLAGTGGFSGTDGFAGYNCSAIVVELPLSMVSGGNTSLSLWASTERQERTIRRSSTGKLERHVGPFQQVDRAGNPAINSALIPSAKKDFFNIGLPQNDAADFAADIVASLTALGTDATNIAILASVALPDTLKLDVTQPVGYPNGRDLDDDVIDTLFFFIFNQTVVPDGVPANDAPFLPTFPYLAGPFQS